MIVSSMKTIIYIEHNKRTDTVSYEKLTGDSLESTMRQHIGDTWDLLDDNVTYMMGHFVTTDGVTTLARETEVLSYFELI